MVVEEAPDDIELETDAITLASKPSGQTRPLFSPDSGADRGSEGSVMPPNQIRNRTREWVVMAQDPADICLTRNSNTTGLKRAYPRSMNNLRSWRSRQMVKGGRSIR